MFLIHNISQHFQSHGTNTEQTNKLFKNAKK
nr:MAG TPA: hypothetical protein [Caudoviricetes sp.]